MRHIHRWLLLFFSMLLCHITLAAPLTDPALLDVLRTAPTAKDYPGDDAVWLLREMDITVEATGAYTVREHKLLKILTPDGLRLAQWEIPYDRTDETLTVETARTLLDGQAIALDAQRMVDNSIYPGTGWYDAMTVRRFPLPGATVGSVLDVTTVLQHRRPRVPQAFSTRLSLQQACPIHEARFTVRTPAEMPLTVRCTGDHPPHVQEQAENGQRVYRWSVSRVPVLKLTEAQMPPADDLVPSARLTTLTAWQPVVAWYQDITSGKDAVSDDLRRVALERTAACHTVDEQLAALHRAVREIPYVATELGELNDTPHAADDMARQNYGDCKDKATLLRALLRAVNIPADYVLVRTTDRGALDPQQYGADEFNHVLLVAHTPGGDRFLDATIADVPWNQLPPTVDGAQALIIRGNGELVTLPTSTAAENATEITVTVTVRDDGSATGTATLTFHGINAMLQRGMLSAVAKEQYRQALEGYLAPRLGSEVTLTTVTVDALREPEQPLVITVAFTSSAYLQLAGAQWLGTLPAFAYQPNHFRGATTRAYPCYQALDSRLHLDATITLPAGYQFGHLPESFSFTSPLGRYQDAITTAGLQLRYRCDLTSARGLFPATMLTDIRRWASVLAQDGRNQMQFFVRKP